MLEVEELATIRADRPEAIAVAAAARRRPAGWRGEHGRLMIIAADHPARGALRAGPDPLAMGNRADLLRRICTALARPGVNGVLGTPDIIEDLLLLGALDDKFVIGSMNRGGLAGTSFEIDDRFTAYDGDSLAAAGLEGGKMLLRIDPEDPGTVATIESCGRAVGDLAAHKLMAMVEPFISHRVDGRVRNELSAEAMIRAMTVAAGLGSTSAYTWLKVPVVAEMERVMAATTLPALILGGEVAADAEAAYAQWSKALALPTVQGLVIGRSLLYPSGGDVADAVDRAVGLL
ncbi:aldolase [Actinoplanes sp. ATCC 53533]|uniref:Cgl0159 family (beta/alpha)8-fold protein n=1 Tax=Actinoplanes sp. ATCC 53533 TaxID=1288362 RepID=UPI000F7A0D97|nr:aldolase [Actinoplanes sp. ATCC 53533]RSM46215.1 aldolase [Actinoplanes sp. ATCC 53533]